MPKVNKIQSSFNAGEISKQAYGHVDNPRYDQGLTYCQNYLPILQGPLTRRPGTKFVNFVKDSTKPPVLIPFQFSATQNYMLEFGDKYIRFYQNEGQITLNTTAFVVNGTYTQPGQLGGFSVPFSAIRSSALPGQTETIISTSAAISGAILELNTDYNYADLKNIKYTQKQDTLYLTHQAYPPKKLVRTGLNTWDFKQIISQDGPYLPLNSYQTIADAASINLSVGYSSLAGLYSVNLSSVILVQTSPVCSIINAVPDGLGNAIITIASSAPSFQVGDPVFVTGVQGYTSINNITDSNGLVASQQFTNSSANQAYWTVSGISGSSVTLANASSFISTFTGSTGRVQPALFKMITGSSGQYWADNFIPANTSGFFVNPLRPIGLYMNGTRSWGTISAVRDSAHCTVQLGANQVPPIAGTTPIWQMGVYNYLNGFPASCGFHQDRLVLAGAPAFPQQIDGSMTGLYEVFSASGSNAIVQANNAYQFGLNSQEMNQIKWILSSPLGLLAGTQSGEWAVTPSTQNAALSPTNIKADQVTAFGSSDAQAIFVGNAAIYIQRAQRKVRELLYYWQVGNFRSTNLSDLSQHITTPSISKLVSVKEPHAFVWALRADGALLSLTYSRDDITLQANNGWARHILGGRSDGANTPPIVNSVAAIPSGDGSYDESWFVTQRYLNGSTLSCVEYMTKPFDDFQAQETSIHLDCAGTFSSSIIVSNLTVAGSCVVTANNHGLTNSSTVRFYGIQGMNISFTDINGNVNSSNPLNYQTFVVSSVSTNNFFIRDFNGNYINTNSCSIYVGSGVVNKLVTSISGVTWLAGETVSVVADGGIHVNTTVSQAGVLTLAYPSAKVNFGYSYNSDAQMLRSKDGSAQGTSIGATRRVNRVAFMLHNVGDFSYGTNFLKLIPAELFSADSGVADNAPPLFDGIYRDGIESEYSFDDLVCWRQSSGLPGMVQAVTRFIEEQDV